MKPRAAWVHYAQRCAWGATTGLISGVLLSSIVQAVLHVREPWIGSAGFCAGALLTPLAEYLFGPGVQGESLPTEDVHRPAIFQGRTTRAVSYAWAASLGATLGCLVGIVVAYLSPGKPAHVFSVGGFVLGALAGVIVEAYNGGLFSTAPTEKGPVLEQSAS